MNAMDRFTLDGRVAVVTGGTRGLGEGFAGALADAGASVMLVGRDAEQGRRASEELLRPVTCPGLAGAPTRSLCCFQQRTGRARSPRVYVGSERCPER